MGQHPKLALPLSGFIGSGTEGAPESPLVPAEGGFGLPPLAVHPPVTTALRLLAEPLDHLPAVRGLRPLPASAPAVQGDDGGPDPEFLPGVGVVGLGVERRVGQHSVPGDHQRRLGHDRGELRGVVGRAGADTRPGEEVGLGIDGDGELGPQPGRVLTPGPFEVVAGGMPALQPGAVHRGRRVVADQAAVGCGRGGAGEEDDGLPFLSSLPAA
jgi:hypothetical protein